jgi:DNA-binding NarL/FixJ family response regulator
VGRDAAEKLCAHFRIGHLHSTAADDHTWSTRGAYLLIPQGPAKITARAKQRAVEALARGATANEAARESGLSIRTVFRLRAALRSQKRRP